MMEKLPVYTLEALAQLLGASLESKGVTHIHGLAPLHRAQQGEISFCTRANQKELLATTQASAVIVRTAEREYCKTAVLIVDDPQLAYAKTARLFDTRQQESSGIHPSAVIDDSVELGAEVCVGANTTIAAGCLIGDGVVIGAGCCIGQAVQIGEQTRLWDSVNINHHVQIGKYVQIQSGAVIGADGFGYANEAGKWLKIPQTGRVILGDHVEIGANTTIDRGTLDDTIIADQVIIDNLCHIAHNVSIGYGSALAGGVMIAGSTVVGRHCMIGGASVINGHITICDHVTITGMCMLMRSVEQPGTYSSGIPAQPNHTWRKTAARVLRIEELHQRMKLLEKHILKNSS